MKWTALFLAAAAFLLTPAAPASSAELLMFRQSLCEWCDRWDEEVGQVYDMTAEGRSAPLRMLDIDSGRDGGLGIKPVVYTPTFVLVHQGREVGRILGYPGEAFFWELLEEMLERVTKAN